ncbi:hypothetical protein [Selenihalanaerobacter shriftii]|uniref:Uncharacterized protein n=1 Tax=Selenihalanaerobacter shriftii TaxID=142842 RepID=A0A1T4L2N2_9FIRM|nr:hypothetical protein [Selenihalanaerobacter shriftii]SJZ48903.1 hypothetical protein SAMN02745118_01007 [Selenihalanaerobacter shriftii]
MKKNLTNLLIFICVILAILGISYKLNKINNKQIKNPGLQITIEGGGKIIKNNIKELIIFKDKGGELEYLQIKDLENKEEEVYNFDRIINLNYGPKIKQKIKFKPLSQLQSEVK